MRKNINRILALAITASVAMGTSAFAAPSEIYAHKPVKVWDYHKTNYDENGNIRYKPSTTTFKTVKTPAKVDKRIPSLTSKDTLYGNDVEINFDKSGEWENWSKNIYKVMKADINSNNPNMEQVVKFDVRDNKIILDKESRSIDHNDKMRIKIYSKGYETVNHTIHIVEKAPELRIHPDFKPVVGQDILFELKNFNYGVVNPIYEVVLDGKVLQGGCKDYHVISSLVRLERGGVIKTSGKHTIVVKAVGFQDAVKEFIVEEVKDGYKNPETDHNKEINNSSNNGMFTTITTDDGYKIDGVTSASITGGSSGASSGGGSILMPANLIFDFDLISNAYILKDIGMETEESEKVLELWETSLKDAATLKGSDKTVTWSGFANAVMDARVNGKHLTFEEYINSNKAEEYKNKPYNIKYVLEDGLLGETQSFNEAISKETPKVTVDTTLAGQDVVLKFETNTDWEKAITNIKVGSTTLSKTEYKIENGKITINTKRFTKGENSISIEAKDFKTVSTNVFIKVKDIEAKASGNLKVGSVVEISNLDEEYIRNINHITLNGKELLSEIATGSDGDYETYSNKIVLNAKLFSETGRKVLILKSYGYEEKVITFDIDKQSSTDPSVETPTEKVLPEVKVSDGRAGEDVVITFNGNNDWQNNIKSIAINNWPINSTKYSVENSKIIIDKSAVRKGENNIEIKADGYKTISIEVNMIASTPKLTVEKANLSEGILIKYPSNEWVYGNNVSSVMIDDIEIEKKNYKVGYLNDLQIVKEVLNVGEHKVTIKANGYEDAVLNITIKQDNTVPETKLEESKPTQNTEDKDSNKEETNDVKDMVEGLKDAPQIESRDLPFVLGSTEFKIKSGYSEDWLNSIERIIANGKEYDKSKVALKNKSSQIDILVDGQLLKSKDNTIIIKANGYKDATFKLTTSF